MAPTTPPSLDAVRAQADSAGIFLDFDGTLSEIVARPELAEPVAGAAEAVAGISRAYALVAVVSGRPSAEVETLLGVEGIRYEGCYGLESAAAALEVVEEVSSVARAEPASRVEPKGVSVAVHFRGAEDPAAARDALGSGLSMVAARHGLELIEGKMVLELVPAGAARKGGVVERLAPGLTAILYAGDDAPDLEAFEALERLRDGGLETVRVAVRGPETPERLLAAADLVVDGPAGLVEMLRQLA